MPPPDLTLTPPEAPADECPSRDDLQALLHGDLAPPLAVEVTEHVGRCCGCQERMEAEASGEVPLLSAAVRNLPLYEPPADSPLWRAIDSVVGEVTRTGAYRAVAADPDLAFLTPTDLPGRLGTLGPFEVIRMIGRGGMGVVLHAFDPDLHRDVALKVLDPELSSNKTARQRFCREARAAAAVTHENIVTVHQVNEDERSGLPYLVMQLVNGESLEQRLRRVGKLGWAEAARVGAQAAAGVAAAHAQGLIHRDVKPGNILLEADDKVRLTDFGLARAAEDLKLTRTGYVSGTPLYMAPEQARGDEVDARADLFSLGVVLYEAVAGQPPFAGKTPLAVLREVADTPHRRLRKLAPDVPGWFEDVVDGLLAKRPSDRATSAADVAAVLAAHTAGANGVCDTAPSVPCPVLPKSTLSKVTRRKYQRRLAAVLTLPFLLGLGAGAVGTWGLLGTRPAPQPSAAAPPPSAPDGQPGEPPLDTPLHPFDISSGTVWSAAACADGKTLAVGSEDGRVRLYDLSARRLTNTFSKHKGPVWGLDFHPTDHSKFVSASDDGTVKLWNLANKDDPQELFAGASGVRAVAYSPDGEYLAVGERNGTVVVLNVQTGERVRTIQHGSSLTAVAFSPVGKGGLDLTLATAGSDKTVRVWSVATESLLFTLEGHVGPVYAVAFSPNGEKIASGGWEKVVRVWDGNSGRPLRELAGNQYGVWSLAFTPCCEYVASAGQDGSVRVWHAGTGEEVKTLRAHHQPAHVVRFARENGGGHAPTATLVSGGRDGFVRLWELTKEH